MGAKDELKCLFIGDEEISISGIPEFPGDLIAYALQTFDTQNNSVIFAGKSLEFETEFKLTKENALLFAFPERINQNNFRKMHGIPKRRKINGSRKNKRLSRMENTDTADTCQRNC